MVNNGSFKKSPSRRALTLARLFALNFPLVSIAGNVSTHLVASAKSSNSDGVLGKFSNRVKMRRNTQRSMRTMLAACSQESISKTRNRFIARIESSNSVNFFTMV